MLIKPSPNIQIKDIKSLLEPVFSLDHTGNNIYELNINGATVKHCTECEEPHNNFGIELCKSCNQKINKELRGYY